jgi:hypothetical protein
VAHSHTVLRRFRPQVYGVPLSVDAAMGLGAAYAVAAAAVAWWANTDKR